MRLGESEPMLNKRKKSVPSDVKNMLKVTILSYSKIGNNRVELDENE